MLTNEETDRIAWQFAASHDELQTKFCMRISPKFYLKQLVVALGQWKRVYEIGKQFKNEGIGLTHNLEFTTCDFYMAFADYNDMMVLTEQMLSGMVKDLTGGYKIKYHANGYDKDPIEIDFSPPFRRIDMIEELEKLANLSIPKDLSSEVAHEYLSDACMKLDGKRPHPQPTGKLLEKLVGYYLEVTCTNPTFIIKHPEIISPLAMWHKSKPGLTERFQLFINQNEVCNEYTAVNDRDVLYERSLDGLPLIQPDEDEAMAENYTLWTVMEYGSPQTAAWGMGIDQITMLLTDSQNIKEVILFPAMMP